MGPVPPPGARGPCSSALPSPAVLPREPAPTRSWGLHGRPSVPPLLPDQPSPGVQPGFVRDGCRSALRNSHSWGILNRLQAQPRSETVGSLLPAAPPRGTQGPKRWLSPKLSSSGSGCHIESSLPCASPCSWGCGHGKVCPVWVSAGDRGMSQSPHTDASHGAALCFPGCRQLPGHNPLRANSSPFGMARNVVGRLPYVSGVGTRTPVLETLRV